MGRRELRRHSREGGNPVGFADVLSLGLDPRLRGDDGVGGDSAVGALHG